MEHISKGNDYESKIEYAWKKYRETKKDELYPTIMLLGASGVGKSSLINTIFKFDKAKISNIKPETEGYVIYMGKDYGTHVNIIDTAGYELQQADDYYKYVQDAILNGIKGNNIHIVWYCIPIVNERIENMDINTLKKLFEEPQIRRRLYVVFTKCDEDDEYGSTAKVYRNILEKNFSSIKCFETSIHPDFPLDLSKLIEWSVSSIDDEDLRRQFISAQFCDLDEKKKLAQDVIKESCIKAAAAGAIPIPIADSAILIPVQVSMIGDIIDIYGLSILETQVKSIVSDVIISQIGKSIAKLLSSFIPFVGIIFKIATSAINASVASAITAALGHSISQICYKTVKKYLNSETVNLDEVFDSKIIEQYVKEYKNTKED